MIIVCAQTDKIMLKIFINEEATGIYSAAVDCAMLTNFVFSAIINSVRPVIFTSQKVSKNSFQFNMKTLFLIIIYLSLIQCVVMTVLSKTIIKVLYGNAYISASPILKIVVWYTIFAYIGGVRGIWMLAEEKQKYVVWISLCAAMGNVVLNTFFIPSIGISGAAIASLLSQILANIILPLLFDELQESNILLFDSLNPSFFKGLLEKYIRRIKGR